MGRMFDHAVSVLGLIKELNAKRIAEIGVWKSKFLKHVLRRTGTLMEYWAVDRWDMLDSEHGRMSRRTSDDWNAMYEHACSLMTWFQSLRVLRMESVKAAELFKDGYFDLVFIDGSHFYKDVKADIDAWQSKVRKGGILCGHDYGLVRKCGGVKRAVDEAFMGWKIKLLPGSVWMVTV